MLLFDFAVSSLHRDHANLLCIYKHFSYATRPKSRAITLWFLSIYANLPAVLQTFGGKYANDTHNCNTSTMASKSLHTHLSAGHLRLLQILANRKSTAGDASCWGHSSSTRSHVLCSQGGGGVRLCWLGGYTSYCELVISTSEIRSNFRMTDTFLPIKKLLFLTTWYNDIIMWQSHVADMILRVTLLFLKNRFTFLPRSTIIFPDVSCW